MFACLILRFSAQRIGAIDVKSLFSVLLPTTYLESKPWKDCEDKGRIGCAASVVVPDLLHCACTLVHHDKSVVHDCVATFAKVDGAEIPSTYMYTM